jgi:molybdate transport system ATP-binding protein
MKLQVKKVRLPLENYTLSIDVLLTGKIVAIYGSSGAGKTTLLDVIIGLRNVSSAFIQLGERVLEDTENGIFVPIQKRRVGYVPQEGGLFPHLSVAKNLKYGYEEDRECPEAFSFSHVVEVMKLAHLLKRDVYALSGGEKQRVALGRALLSFPELLLLDEPMGSLDSELKGRIIPYLRKIRDEFGVPMLYVTHSSSEVMALCDEVVVLSSGEVKYQGKPEDLFVESEEKRYCLRD